MSSSMNWMKTGSWVGNGADRKIVLGFKPRKVHIVNLTDRIEYVQSDSMGTDALKRAAAGAGTLEAAAMTLNSDGFTLLAAENVAAKAFHYVAEEGKNE